MASPPRIVPRQRQGANSAADSGGGAPRPRRKKPKTKRTWPYALALLGAWGAIFGAVFFFRWVSDLPDTNDLLAKGPSHDVTILDSRGRLIARRGLTQGQMVLASNLPDYVSNAFIAIEDRRFRYHPGGGEGPSWAECKPLQDYMMHQVIRQAQGRAAAERLSGTPGMDDLLVAIGSLREGLRDIGGGVMAKPIHRKQSPQSDGSGGVISLEG